MNQLSEYSSTKTLAFISIAGLGAIVLIEILFTVFGFGEAFAPMTSGLRQENGSEMSLWILLIGLVALLRIPLFVLTVIFFLIWLNQSYKNLPALKSRDGEFTSGWAVGWWFIPFANLVKPFQVVRELWQRSDPDFNPDLNFMSNSMVAPTFMGFWWAFWIVSNILGRIGENAFDDKFRGNTMIFMGIFVLGSLFNLTAGLLLIKIIWGILKRQELRHQNIVSLGLRQTTELPPPPPIFG